MSQVQIAQTAVAPGVIDLGVGHPGFSILPLALVRRSVGQRLEQEDPSFLQYGFEQGDILFRRALADFLSRAEHGTVDAEQLFITAGASQGLDLICTLFTQPGDTIFVEEPSYFLALQIFADHKLRVISLATDRDGLIVEDLEQQLARHKPAFLYTIPAFQNPTSATLPLDRRQRLVELSQRYGFLIVADEVYQLLSYTESPPATLGSMAGSGTVLSLGSFSKILAPGLRLGWVQAASPLIEKLVSSGLLQSGGGLNPFTSALVRSALEHGWQREYLDELRSIYQRRVDVMNRALREQMPAAVSYRVPGGGFFFWLRLPEELNAAQLLSAAERDHQVSFQPGAKFSARGALHNYLRLSFAFYDEADLLRGVERLVRAVRGYRR